MKHVFVNLEFVRIEKISLIKTSHLFQQLDLLFQDMCCGRRRPSSFAQLSSQELRLHFGLLESSPELNHLSLQPLEISEFQKLSGCWKTFTAPPLKYELFGALQYSQSCIYSGYPGTLEPPTSTLSEFSQPA